MNELNLVFTSANGSPQSLSLAQLQTLQAEDGVVYTIIDSTLNKSPKELILKRKGDNLDVEVEGEIVARIEGFYTPGIRASFSTNGSLTLNSDESVQGANADDEGIVWPVDNNDSAFPTGKVLLGAAGLGLLGVALSSDDDDNPVSKPDTNANAPSVAFGAAGVSNNNTLNVTLAGDVASWEVSLDGGVTWQAGTGTSFELPDNSYAAGDIQVRQTDTSKNVSSVSSNINSLVIDTIVPAAPALTFATEGTPTQVVEVTLGDDTVSWQWSLDGGVTWVEGTGTPFEWQGIGNFELPEGTEYAPGDIQVRQTDAAGNVSPAASNADAVIVPSTDTTEPTLTITDNTEGAAIGDVTYTFTFSEDVTGFTAEDVTVTGGTPSAFTAVSAVEYTLVVTPTAESTTDITVNVAASVASDNAGNDNAAATESIQTVNTVTPDTTAPIVTITDDTEGTATGIVTYTFTFSEDVIDFTMNGVNVSNGSKGTFTVVSATEYTLVVAPLANVLSTMIVSVAANAATNASGTGNAAAQASQAFNTLIPDATPPTVTITDDTTGTATGDVTYTFTFSEDVTGFTADDISITGGTKGGFTGTGSVYTLVVTPPAESTTDITVDVAASVATDTAGNNNTAATQSVQLVDTITPDTTAPTVTITDDTTGTAIGEVTYTFTFSEPVTGFDANGIDITGGTKGTFTAISATEYTLVVTPNADSTTDITVDVAASVATDAAGNGNTAATQSVQIVDTEAPAAPSLSLATDTGNSNSDGITNNATVNVTLAADMASWEFNINGAGWTAGTGSSFALADDTVYGANHVEVRQSDAAGNVSAVGSNATTITTDMTIATPILALADDTGSSNSDGITNDATVNVTLAADVDSWEFSTNGGASWTTGTTTSFDLADDTTYAAGDVQVRQTDAAGNVSAAGSNAAITTDMTIATPILALADDTGSSNSDGITNNATVNVTLAADVDSWEFSTDGGTSWSAGTASSFTLADNTTYAVGAVQVRQTDTAGNISAAGSNAAAITTDMTAPTVSIVMADTSLLQGEASLVTFTFSEAPVDFTATDITVPNGGITGFTATADPLVYEATYTPAANIVDPTNIISVNTGYTDEAGNTGVAADSTNFTINTTTIVVFDLVNGLSSNHSGRTFDPLVTYSIYMLVDSTSGGISAPFMWQGGDALGADDRIILVGSGAEVIGLRGAEVTTQLLHWTAPSVRVWRTSAGDIGFAMQPLPAGVFAIRIASAGGADFTTVWTGIWSTDPNIDNSFAEVYFTALPTSITLPV